MDRIVSGKRHEEDLSFDVNLRPRHLKEYIGQTLLKENLGIAIAAAKKRDEALDHVLLYGPPGLGKTTLANILSVEMGVNLKTTSGPAIERPADIVSILTQMKNKEMLFIVILFSHPDFRTSDGLIARPIDSLKSSSHISYASCSAPSNI